jgi:hypothetical protein
VKKRPQYATLSAWLAVCALLEPGQELCAGTNTTALAIISFSRDAAGAPVLGWSAETNAFGNLFFTVESTPALGTNFAAVSPLISENSSLVFTGSAPGVGESGFYRVSATPAFTALSQAGAFSAYPATNVGGLNTMGYAGAVFDGRYIYFVPYQDGASAHGRVLRYDTHGDYNRGTSWSAYDASGTGPGGAMGYTGGVFDGRYVYFSPQTITPPGPVLRYDTLSNFTNSVSWAAYNAANTEGLACQGTQGAIFDGRFVYFVPHYNGIGIGWGGVVLRYDTRTSFTNAASWQAHNATNTSGLPTQGYSSGVFDGRYVYFAPTVNGVSPNGNGCVLRYDTQNDFHNSSSWLAYDASSTDGQRATIFKGAVFDGRYVFFVPYLNGGNCVVLRYDTQSPFTNGAAWAAWNATNTSGLQTEGYDGAVFDGRFITFVPYHTSGSLFHGVVLSYDTYAPFAAASSWHAFDAGGTGGLATQGYVGAVSDGRYVYFAPSRNTNSFSGNVLRFDARLPRGIPPTVTGGSNL